MTKTGMNAVAPIEPYKLFAKINQNIAKSKPELERLKLERAQHVSVPGRSNQPVGFASIGFAAFWPNGGGPLPSSSSVTSTPTSTSTPTPTSTESDNTLQSQPEAVAVAE